MQITIEYDLEEGDVRVVTPDENLTPFEEIGLIEMAKFAILKGSTAPIEKIASQVKPPIKKKFDA